MSREAPDSLKKQVLTDAREAIDGNDYLKMLRHRWGKALAVIATALAVGIAASGGFSRVEKPTGLITLTPQAAGVWVDAGLYKVRVDSAWISHRVSQRLDYLDPDRSTLYLHATVIHQDTSALPSPETFAQDLVWISGTIGGDTAPKVADSTERTGGAALTLQPGVPTDAVLGWRLEASGPAPALMQVAVMGHEFTPSTWLTQEEGWLETSPVGLWQIAIDDRRAAERAAVETSP